MHLLLIFGGKRYLNNIMTELHTSIIRLPINQMIYENKSKRFFSSIKQHVTYRSIIYIQNNLPLENQWVYGNYRVTLLECNR